MKKIPAYVLLVFALWLSVSCSFFSLLYILFSGNH